MPKEFRKRGKRSKKNANDVDLKPQEDHYLAHDNIKQEQRAGPSWIIPAPKESEDINFEAPFGYLDADVKAYFRTVDVQIRNWQDNKADTAEGNDDVDPNEERRLFFVAALTEMTDKEKQLATDPDCSNILERMSYSMDDFARRVFVDRLAGSYDTLVRHRFASHVCQTLFTVASDTIARENKGILPSTSDSFDEGELRTLTELTIAVCEELYSSFTSLIMDPFASHVIRALLLLLSPSLHSSHNPTIKSHTSVRSKKSAAWKARQAPMKNVFAGNKSKESETPNVPKQFREVSANFVHILRKNLSENEIRALAADKVASPVLQMLLEVEADQGLSDKPDSLMDRLLVGVITSYNEDSSIPEESEYLSTLFRDATSSHLLETLVTRSPELAFTYLWSTYFKGKLVRLAVHPVANFVVARAMERVNAEQFEEVCEEMKDAMGKIIKSSKTGVLRAMVDRAAVLCSCEKEIGEAICTAFGLTSPDDRRLFVSCVMVLKPLQQYQSLASSAQTRAHDRSGNNAPGKKGDGNATEDPLEPKVQGAVLLQSLLRLNEPHNQLVTDSIMSLPIEDLLRFAHHATSSRVFDAIFESPSVPFKVKRNFVMRFIGQYHFLVDDRIGSRVGDRCWAFADPYLREKIARSLFTNEQFLAGSFYGKFFARNLNLYLLQRKPEEWKELQSRNKLASSQPTLPLNVPTSVETPVLSSTSESHKKRKRKRDAPDNEIDAVFDATFSKRVKKGALDTAVHSSTAKSSHNIDATSPSLKGDRGLLEVLGAIRAAPKVEKGGAGKKRRPR